MIDCIRCILFIYSQFYGHLSCFHFLAITIMLLWIFMYKLLCRHTFSVLWAVHLGGELLRHMKSLGLTVYGAAKLFLKMATPHSKFWPAGCEAPNSPHLCHVCYCLSFKYSHPGGYEVVTHCGRNFVLLNFTSLLIDMPDSQSKMWEAEEDDIDIYWQKE